MRSFVHRFAAAVALASVAGSAAAATSTTTFDVTTTVIPSCSVVATNLGFGDYDPLLPTAKDGTSNLNVTCTLTTEYTIGLSAGTHANGSGRRMQSDALNHLAYSLYKDVNRAQEWTEASTVDGTGTGELVNHPVYGRIPPSQIVTPGAYSDTISVTVNF